MGRPVYSLEQVFAYRLLSPILMLPRVWIQFLAASFSWFFLAVATVWGWNATIYWIPTFALGAFALVAPFQESQVFVISILENIFEVVDLVFDDTLFPIAEALVYFITPVCWAYNFLWDIIMPIFQFAIYNPIKLFLLILFPVDPMAFFKTIKIQTRGFPIAFTIDSSSSPDWVTGPYDRRSATTPPASSPSPPPTGEEFPSEERRDPLGEEEPPARFVLNKQDPVARFLLRWLDNHTYDETGARHGRIHPDTPGIIGMTFMPGELERWTDPRQPEVVRKATAETILRRAMDRSLGLEHPSWWEDGVRRDYVESMGAGDGDGADAAASPQPLSRWHAIFSGSISNLKDDPNPRGDHVGLVRMDDPIDIPADLLMSYGPSRAENLKDMMTASDVSYRFVALGPDRERIANRNLIVDAIMSLAGFMNDLIGKVAELFIDLTRIAARVGVFLFGTLEDFFTDAFSFVANIFNEVWAEFLDLPCLKFDSFEVFAISLMDCICGPLTQAIQSLSSQLGRWFNYERPSDLGGVPQAFLGCVGLGCMDIDLLISGNPLLFVTTLLMECAALPGRVVCCLVNPIGCFNNLVVHVIPCACEENFTTVGAPGCQWMGGFDRWLRCIFIWLTNTTLADWSGNDICRIDSCLNAFDLAKHIMDCFGALITDLSIFTNWLKGEVKKIAKDAFSILSRDGPPDDNNSPTWNRDGARGASRTPPLASTLRHRRPRLQISDTGSANNNDHHSPDNTVAMSYMDVPEEYRYSPLMRRLYYNSATALYHTIDTHALRTGGFNRTDMVARYGPSAVREVENLILHAEATRHFEFEIQSENDIATFHMRRTGAEDGEESNCGEGGWEDETLGAFDGGGGGSGAASSPLGSTVSGWLPDPTPLTAPLIKLLTTTVGKESQSRHRARAQAYADRRLYSNPYIRAATGRFAEIARDLTDFLEFRIYGPDPFVQPAADADPRRDIRAVHHAKKRQERGLRNATGALADRYLEEVRGQQSAYVMHAQDVKDNAYYAGAYKVLFQINMPRACELEGGGADTECVHMNREAWEAMREHMDDPYFHMGRLMAGSRQMAASYIRVISEAWWDSDSFSFHFPSMSQITDMYLQMHIQVYSDDMHSALKGLLHSASMEGDAILQRDVRALYRANAPTHLGEASHAFEADAVGGDSGVGEYEDEELYLDPEGARPLEERGITPLAQRYSWIIQGEIVARTFVTRLLAPQHLDAVLDEVATSSPLHAMYAERMRNRMHLLDELSPHQADPLKRHSTSLHIYEQFREELMDKDRRMRSAGFRTVHLAEPEDLEERELWTRDGRGSNTTRIDQRDGNWDYYGNGVEFYEGQSLRFPDGRRGRFLGTMRSVTRKNPVARALVRTGAVRGTHVLAGRATVIGTIIGIVQQVIQFIMANWEWIASLFMALIASPPIRVFWESWLHFAWVRLVKPLYKGGLKNIFGSFSAILDLGVDFLSLNDAISAFLITELHRYQLCWAWGFFFVIVPFLPAFFILSMLTVGLGIIPLAVVLVIGFGIAFFLPYCPPDQIVIDGFMQQTIFSYTDDIIQCIGNQDIGSINIGKGVYNGVCSSALDCPGRAPCRCENKGMQFNSLFVALQDTTLCGSEQAPTGQCLCWPKFPCEFLIPRLGLRRFFDVNCADEYGYNISDITWYQTNDYFLIAYNAYQNFWIALAYLTRLLTRSPGINPILFMLVVGIAFLIIFYLSIYAGAVILAALGFVEYVLPLWKRIVIEALLPAARTVINGGIWPLPAITIWLVGFLRWPNHDEDEEGPLGSAGSGEGTCFIFNAPTTLGGLALTFWFWAFVIAISWHGAGALFWLTYHHVAAPFRSGWAIIWYVLQLMRKKKRIEAIETAVRTNLPAWMRRGASRTKRAATRAWQYTKPIRGALVPREPEHRFKALIDSALPPLEYHHLFNTPPTVSINGGVPEWGGGVLDAEIHDTLPAGEGGSGPAVRRRSQHQQPNVRQRTTRTAGAPHGGSARAVPPPPHGRRGRRRGRSDEERGPVRFESSKSV